MSLNEQSPVKILYNTALELNEVSEIPVSNWIADVKNTLFKHGFGYVWINQQYINDIDFF